MVKNYSCPVLLLLLFLPGVLSSQEIRIFTMQDFDLRGRVKSCMVSTDYGKEEYEFNEDGLLTKSVTRYNDTDYDVTHYTYKNSELLEKRFENYRDNQFDNATSIANFYTIDTTGNRKILEKIMSYDKVFLDQYEYRYDANGRLIKVIRTNDQGIDETQVEYKEYRGEQTVSYVLNGELQKSIRTSSKKRKNGSLEKIVLTKKYLNGTPHTASEEVFDEQDMPVSKINFFFDTKTKQFSPESEKVYTYDDFYNLIKLTTNRGEEKATQEYVYQFDDNESANWVKQITTPENAYKTRKISYYEALETDN